jgi:excisionase family DNA binding protein
MMQKLLSVEQVAERLGGISKWTVHAWLSKGKLRRTKIGSRTMISETDLLAFIEGCNPSTKKSQTVHLGDRVRRAAVSAEESSASESKPTQRDSAHRKHRSLLDARPGPTAQQPLFPDQGIGRLKPGDQKDR